MSKPRTGICPKCDRTTFPWNARGDLRCDFCDAEPPMPPIPEPSIEASFARIADQLQLLVAYLMIRDQDRPVPTPPGSPVDPFSDQRS